MNVNVKAGKKGLNIWQYILWELQIHLQATYTSQSSTDCLQSLTLKATSCQEPETRSGLRNGKEYSPKAGRTAAQ